MIFPPFTDPRLTEMSRILIAEDERNFKKGRDLELARGERIILRASDGSKWALVVATDGTLSTVAA